MDAYCFIREILKHLHHPNISHFSFSTSTTLHPTQLITTTPPSIEMQLPTTPFLLLTLLTSVSALNCSVKGYDTGKVSAYYFNPNITTVPACKAFCAASTVPKCDSFAVGAACLLYNVTVAANVVPMNTSAFTFYDAGCVV